MFEATDENNFEVAMGFYVAEHILTGKKKSELIASVLWYQWD